MQQNPLAMAAGNTLMLTVTLASLNIVKNVLAGLAVLLILLSIFIDPNLTCGIMLIVLSLGAFGVNVARLGVEDKATEIAQTLMESLTGAMTGLGTSGPPTPHMQAEYDTEAAPRGKTDWPTDQ